MSQRPGPFIRIPIGWALPGLLGPLTFLALAAFLASIPGQIGDGDRSHSDPAQDTQLNVVFTLPNGAVDEVPSVDVLFNRSMRPLGKERRGDEDELLVISPAVPGRMHWIGSRALRFVSEQRFPRATVFTARVPAGVKDATGMALPREVTFTFSTTPPAVESTRPYHDSSHHRPRDPIFLVFNQPVKLERLATATRLVAGGTPVPFRCTRPDSAELASFAFLVKTGEEVAVLRTERPLPLASDIEVTIDSVPIATEGPLPLDQPFEGWPPRRSGSKSSSPQGDRSPRPFFMRFRTYGPLALIEGNATTDGVWLTFSNPVYPETLAAHVRLTGPAVADTAMIESYGEEPLTHHFFAMRLRPGSPLVARIDTRLRDQFEQFLGHEETLELATPDLHPDLEILPEHGTLEARGPRRAAVRAVNLQHVTVRAAALTANQAATLLRQRWELRASERNPFAGTKPEQRTHRLAGTRNKYERVSIDLDGLLGGRRRGGFVLIRAGSPDRFTNPHTGLRDSIPDEFSIVQVTDLGLVAKATVSEVLVWATSLQSGEPLAGVELRILDHTRKTIWRARSGRDGLARAAAPTPWGATEGWTLIARRGRDETILLVDEDWELRPWAFHLPGEYPYSLRTADAFLFTDREIYRPGDTVHVKGIVRAIGRPAVGPAPLDSVLLHVNAPDGKRILDRRIKLSDFDTFALDLPLKTDAGLGRYWGELSPLPRPAPPLAQVALRGSMSFRLEAYRPAAFRVNLDLRTPSPARPTAPDRPVMVVRGESLVASIRARTFFDSPLAGSPVKMAIRRERRWWSPAPDGPVAKALAGYSFIDHTLEETPGELVTTANATLDAGGEAQISAELALPEVSTPQSLEVEVEVWDTGNRVVAAHRTAEWFPAEVQVGLKAEPTVVATGNPVAIAVVAATLAGKPEANVAVRLEWARRTWHTVRRRMVGGRLGYHSEAVETVLDSALVTTTADFEAPAVARFVPDRPGAYVVRAKARDAAGRETRSADFVWVQGSGYVAWSRETGNRLALVADQEAYAPGDTATILVQSPFPAARGLLTLEREGIHEVIPFEARSTAPVLKIPLNEDAMPNLFASVVLVRGAAPGPRTAPDDTLWSGKPEMRIGYVNLPVRPETRRLRIALEAPGTAGPRDSVTVRVRVTREPDARPADAEVTLMLVDEAVLSLLDTRTPDPFAHFYRPRGLGVVNAAKVLHVVEVLEEAEKGREPGGGGGGEDGRYRRLFATTALFAPELHTGPDGVAEASFRLPENLTTFRAMAVACDRRDRLGSGEEPVTVTRPLVLEPLLPRLARVGDRFQAGAVLVNRGTKKLRVRVEIGVEGKNNALAITGDDEKTLSVEPGQSRRVHFTAEGRAAGEATILLSARSTGKGGPSDAVALPLRIEEPVLAVVDAHYGVLSGEDSLLVLPLAVPADADPQDSSIEIQGATTILSGIEEALTYLIAYPYGCLEQQASRLIALAVAKEMHTRVVLTGWDLARISTAMNKGLTEIAKLEHHDGGYRFWPEEWVSEPYLSAYALLAFLEVRDAGAAVDPARLTELAGYLKSEFAIKRRDNGDSTRVRPFTFADALTLSLFARETRIPNSPLHDSFEAVDLERLYKHRKDLDDSGQLLLAAALNLVRPTDARIGSLITPVMNRVSLTGGRAFLAAERGRFGSEELATALALRVLIAAWPDHEIAVPMARWLAQARRSGHWRNTHATAYAVLALRDLARREGEASPEPIAVRAAIGATVLLERRIGGTEPENVSITWPLARLPELIPGGTGELMLRRRAPPSGALAAAKPLYHAIRLESVRPTLRMDAAEAGLTVERRIFAFDPAKPRAPAKETARAAAGDVVRVEIDVVVPRAATDLVLDDPLPAGLEPLILDLETVARSLGRALADRRSGGGRAEIASYEETKGMLPVQHVEMRDDRVVAHAPYVPAGIYRFEYLARAATPGRFSVPPAQAELMYDPEVRGRCAATTFEVAQGTK